MKNKIYYCVGKNHFQEKSIELPEELEPDYVLIKYLFCGICGGDYSTYIGRRTTYPISLGHEFVAEILQTGSNVENLYSGQFVISDFNFRCGKCSYCKQHKSHLCIRNDIQNFTNRAFAEYGIVHKNYLYTLNVFSNLPRACFIEPLSCVIHAVETMENLFDSPILVNGVGSIGTMMVFYLNRILHYENIYVNDMNISRLNNVMKCFQVKEYKKSKIIPRIIIECTNHIGGIKGTLQLAPPGAFICIMSHLYGENTSFIYEELCRKEMLSSFPLRNGNVKNIYCAIDYIEKYWDSEMDSLYYIDNDINRIFHNKPNIPFNKQILDVQNAF